MFGCYESIDFGPVVYMAMARCSIGCHCATALVSQIALDSATFNPLARVEVQFRSAFQQVHPKVA